MESRSSPQVMVENPTIPDGLLVTRMRLILACAGLSVIYIDPAEPDRLVEATYATLILFVIYSLIIHMLARKQHKLFLVIQDWSHWLDLCWYVALISLSSGTNSLFFFGFIFSILTASFIHGFQSGLNITIVSAISFSIIGLIGYSENMATELNRTLIRPVYLLVLGYMLAYWGGYEIKLRRRLTLLKDISHLSNPRFGVDRTIGLILEQLRSFFQADSCLLALKMPFASTYNIYRTTADSDEPIVNTEIINQNHSSKLLALPDELIVAYNDHPSSWKRWKKSYFSFDATDRQFPVKSQLDCETLAANFDCSSFISVPLKYGFESHGRIFITSQRPFDEEDAHFLLQVVKHILPVIDNIRLIDHMASDAAQVERQRIAHDVHDSVIQPYVGLRIGLTALHRKMASGAPITSADIEKLLELTEIGINDLRQYTSSLRSTDGADSGLVAAVKRFTGKFAEATGISVEVTVNNDIHVNDRLAAEALQMIAEGLSNIRRHTQSASATIGIDCQENLLTLIIRNEAEKNTSWVPFIPRSITERAESLGGHAIVKQGKEGDTIVLVEIPL